MASEWFYANDSKKKSGPVSTAQLQALARSGQLQPADLVWRDGMAQWTSASKINGLFPATRKGEVPTADKTRQLVGRGKEVFALVALVAIGCVCGIIVLVAVLFNSGTPEKTLAENKQKPKGGQVAEQNDLHSNDKDAERERMSQDRAAERERMNQERAESERQQKAAEVKDALDEFYSRFRVAQTLGDLRECNQALLKAARINKRAGVPGPGDEDLRKAYAALERRYENLQRQIDVQNPHLGLTNPIYLDNPRVRQWCQIEIAWRNFQTQWREIQ